MHVTVISEDGKYVLLVDGERPLNDRGEPNSFGTLGALFYRVHDKHGLQNVSISIHCTVTKPVTYDEAFRRGGACMQSRYDYPDTTGQ